ncbi:UNVERIFIED_CONTAM: hypothetical protein Sradi_5988000 [Sesamum radiatum]|uniref:Uncharacterized protein n=1 Tax=Sesamum radiatum TaxID=300843 RepID=A0AAW2KHE6_SESRA
MENRRSWEQILNAVTHILTNPTTSPPLHSQLFIATQIPCYINWDYPPLLCRQSSSTAVRWAFSRFLRRASRFGLETSWRSKCPYQLPPRWSWHREWRKPSGPKRRRENTCGED